MNTAILGIGNKLMMDDGIGVYVVDELINNYKKDEITYIIGETDIDYCIYAIKKVERLIIVDSTYSENTYGTIRVFPLHEKVYKGRFELSLHNVNLIDIVRQRYGGLVGFIIGVEVCEINYGIGLSKCLKNQFYKITNEINDIVSKTCQLV